MRNPHDSNAPKGGSGPFGAGLHLDCSPISSFPIPGNLDQKLFDSFKAVLPADTVVGVIHEPHSTRETSRFHVEFKEGTPQATISHALKQLGFSERDLKNPKKTLLHHKYERWTIPTAIMDDYITNMGAAVDKTNTDQLLEFIKTHSPNNPKELNVSGILFDATLEKNGDHYVMQQINFGTSRTEIFGEKTLQGRKNGIEKEGHGSLILTLAEPMVTATLSGKGAGAAR